MKRILLTLLPCVFALLLLALFLKKTPCPTAHVSVKSKPLSVLYALTPAQKEQGLSGKHNNEMMLFDFRNDDKRPTFWMNEMLYDLDAIWIKDGRVSEIDKDLPKPKTKTEQPFVFAPEEDIDFILEVPAGFSTNNSIHINDSFSLEKISECKK